jgi:hypothetical protein
MHSLNRTLRILLIGLALTLLIPMSCPAQVVFSDDFDSFASPSIITSSGTANGYKILAGAASGPEDFSAVFGFDYSTVSVPVTIPSAPRSVGGTTKGLFLTANKDGTGAAAAVNLYPVGQSFSGNFSVTFDVWVNWTTLATSTEHSLVGINHSGNVMNRVGQTGSDGLFFAMNGDGGSSPTSATLRDFSVFRGNGSAIPFLMTTNNTTFGPEPLLGPQFDNANPNISALFPAQVTPATPAGSPGIQWLSGEVRQETNVITWSLNGTVIAQYTNASVYGSGNILLGYNDAFASLGDLNNFVIFDNIRVVALGGPPTVGVTSSINNATEAGPVAGQFTLTRSGNTSGSITVNYTLTGTATNGLDYVTLPGSVVFLAGAASTNISVTPIDDAVSEALESVVLTVASGTGYTIGSPASATVVIVDNDTPLISLSAGNTNLLECFSGSKIPLTVTRLGLTNAALTVNLGYSGAAVAGMDFSSPANVPLPAGAVTAVFNMASIDDKLYEGNETAIVSVAAGTGYNIGIDFSVTNSITDDDIPPAATLFADAFNSTDTATNWVVNQSSGDTYAEFGYDYSVDGIPEAPSSMGVFAARHGLKFRANEVAAIVAGLSASPTNGNFIGDYRLRFDLWLNFCGPFNIANVPGTTQSGSAGVGTTGVEPVWPGGVANDGVWFSATGDGGSGAGPGDYNAYAGFILYDDASGVYAAGTTAPRDNLNAYYAIWPGVAAPTAQVTAHPSQTGTTPAASIGMAWHCVSITRRTNSITWDIDGRRIAMVDSTAMNLSTNIFVGYHDPFNSLTTNAPVQFGLFDNLRVETLSRPSITAVSYASGTVQIDFTAEFGDPPAAFEVLSSSAVTGPFVSATANITQLGNNLFRAQLTVNGSTKFFLIHRL